MRKISVLTALGLLALVRPASALCTSYPNTLTNGTTADGGQVMANFNCAALTSGATINGATLTGTTALPGSGQITSAGSIGIGVTPSTLLDIRKDTNGDSSISLRNYTNGAAASSRMDIFSQDAVHALTFQRTPASNTGSLFGITTSNISAIFDNSTSSNGLLIGTATASPLIFGVTNIERGRFGSDGSFLVGSTINGGWVGNAKAEFRSAGTVLSGYSSGSTGGTVFVGRVDNTSNWFASFYYNAANVGGINTNGTSTAYNTTSDARLKDVEVAQLNYRHAIENLWVGDFKWKKDGSAGFGIVAQQAYTVFPQAIQKPAKEADIWQADYSKLAPLALWGVKDLYKGAEVRDRKIAELESQINNLQQVNAALGGEVDRLHNVNDTISAQFDVLMTRITALERQGHTRTAQR